MKSAVCASSQSERRGRDSLKKNKHIHVRSGFRVGEFLQVPIHPRHFVFACAAFTARARAQAHSNVSSAQLFSPGNSYKPQAAMSLLETDDSYDFVFKIVLVGDVGVGKTCVVQRFKTGTFIERQGNTIGVDFTMKTMEIQGKRVKVGVCQTNRFFYVNESFGLIDDWEVFLSTVS